MFKYLFNIYNLFLKHNIFFPKKSYSCFGEDIFVDKFFKKKKLGFYVDVGSYHPFFWNNTYLLYKKKWNGINIDANFLSVKLFNVARAKDYNFNVAITNKNKKKIKLFYRRKMNVLNTTNEKFAKTNFPNGYQIVNVKCSSLTKILEKTKYKRRVIDFLNIDVESTEKDVLESLNFNIYKPKLICIEIHYNKLKDLKFNKTYQFLLKKGYRMIWSKKYSFIFLNNKRNKKLKKINKF